MQILTYPNPILEQKSQPVALPLSKGDQDIIREMWKLVQGIGVGLAAPQVGVNKQIFIVHLSEDKDLMKGLKERDFVVINPRITFYSKAQVEMVEGCLSFPEEYWRIVRPANIQIEFDSISNFYDFVKKGREPKYIKRKKLLAKDWLSRILQHEFDHLLGDIFIKKGGQKLSKEELEGLEDEVVD